MDPAIARMLPAALDGRRFSLLSCPEAELETFLTQEPVDILVYDTEQAAVHPREAVRSLRRMRPGLRIIVLSGTPPEENIELIEEGIFFYMVKPVGRELAEVVEAAGRVLAARR